MDSLLTWVVVVGEPEALRARGDGFASLEFVKPIDFDNLTQSHETFPLFHTSIKQARPVHRSESDGPPKAVIPEKDREGTSHTIPLEKKTRAP